MNTQNRYAGYSLVAISIVLTLLLALPDANRSRAKARAVVPAADLRAGTTAMEEGTVTLKVSDLKTWQWNTTWVNEPGVCDTVLFIPHQEAPYGQVIVGKVHQRDVYHKYLYTFDCMEQKAAIFQGSLWFDLGEIISKAPSIFVTKATLNFKKISSVRRIGEGETTECSDPHQITSASVDWRKEGYAGSRVPGVDPLPVKCGPGGCSVDVSSVVNNWVRGEEKGGDANYGFVIKAETELSAEEHGKDSTSYACQARYGDFSLTVTYSFPTKKPSTPPQTYPLECRGIETLKIMDFDGPVPYRWVGFNFIPGTKPAKDGLSPGQCSWLDRGMKPGEPARLAQPIEDTQVWNKELNSSDSYWTFNVYNAGDQLQATGAERSKKPGIGIFLAPINLALKKSATQISTFTDGEAYRAVDGNTDGEWIKGSVAATNLENQAWWEVDLGSIRSIKNIKVWNRVEFPARTSDFYVFVSDEPFKSTDLEATKSQLWVKSFFTSGTCGYPTEIAVGKTGRYVRVQLSGTDYLQLAEVEVFAGPK